MTSVSLKPDSTPAMAPVTRLSLPVEGMTCASCVGRVERALKAVPGVDSASVNLATERADLTFSGTADPQAAVHAIENAGYSVREETTELAIGK
ncbi:Copper-transporting P-type ATPase [compost metagenome]